VVLAVEQSELLQAGKRAYGDKWLKNKIKVHVSITNPTDLTFRSRHLIKGMWFIPDLLMRDHRKITFFDVTEIDPGKGEAMYTGMGVGEQYTGPTWDDRAILARGPFLVTLKDAARELLLSQGYSESDIPLPLRPLPKPRRYEERLEELRADGWTATALQAHNQTGYADKRANVINLEQLCVGRAGRGRVTARLLGAARSAGQGQRAGRRRAALVPVRRVVGTAGSVSEPHE